MRIPLCLAVVALLSVGCVYSAPVSVEAERDGVKVVLSVERQTFYPDEPIIAKVTLINATDQPLRLSEPDYCTFRTLEPGVEKLIGEGTMPPIMLFSRRSLPNDLWWEFKPGEARSEWVSFDHLMPEDVLSGEYEMSVTYMAPGNVKEARQGWITTPGLRFCIANDPKANKECIKARNELESVMIAREMDDREARALALAETFHKCADPKIGGRFAPHAGLHEALAYRTAKDNPKYISTLKDYVRKHADVPYSGKMAVRNLIAALYDSGDYLGAYQAAQRLPDSYERRHWLSKSGNELKR